MPTVEDTWLQIRHDLVKASLEVRRVTLEKKTERALTPLLENHEAKGFGETTAREILQTFAKFLEAYAKATCRVYEEVWKVQGNEVMPEFLRAVSQNAIGCVIQEQLASCILVVHGLVARYSPQSSLRAAAEYLQSEARRIQDFHKNRLEVRATKMEYAIERAQARPVAEELAKGQDRSFPPNLGGTSMTMSPGGTGELRELEPQKKESDQRLAAEPDLATVDQTMAFQASSGADGTTDRRAAVNAYIAEVLKKTGKRITRTDIWKTAGYKTRTEFERWERNDSKRPNKAAHRNFTRILSNKPHLK